MQTAKEQDEEFEIRLLNWVRWNRNSKVYMHCGSIEYKYRSPQCWHAQQPKTEVNILDAHLIEDCYRELNLTNRLIIKMHYIKRSDPSWIAKRLRVSELKVDEHIARAIQKLKNVVDKHESRY